MLGSCCSHPLFADAVKPLLAEPLHYLSSQSTACAVHDNRGLHSHRRRPLTADSSLLNVGQLTRPFAALLSRPQSSPSCAQPLLPLAAACLPDTSDENGGARSRSASPIRKWRRPKSPPRAAPPPRPLHPDPGFQLEHISGRQRERLTCMFVRRFPALDGVDHGQVLSYRMAYLHTSLPSAVSMSCACR